MKKKEEHKKKKEEEEVPYSWSISIGKKEGDDEEAKGPTEAGGIRPVLDRDCDCGGSSLLRRRPSAKEEEEDYTAATSISTLISTSSGTCSEATARRTCRRRRRPPSDEKRKRKRTRTRIRRNSPHWRDALLLHWDMKPCSTSNGDAPHDLHHRILLLLRDAETEEVANRVTLGPLLSRDNAGLAVGNARRGLGPVPGLWLGHGLGPVAMK